MFKTEVSLSWNGEGYKANVRDATLAEIGRSADKIRDIAEGLVPKPPTAPYAKGQLVRTIRAKMAKAAGKMEAYVIAGNRDAEIYWAHMVEYGTYHSPAHPFMRPAVSAGWKPDEVAERIRREGLDERRAKAKAGRKAKGYTR